MPSTILGVGICVLGNKLSTLIFHKYSSAGRQPKTRMQVRMSEIIAVPRKGGDVLSSACLTALDSNVRKDLLEGGHI